MFTIVLALTLGGCCGAAVEVGVKGRHFDFTLSVDPNKRPVPAGEGIEIAPENPTKGVAKC